MAKPILVANWKNSPKSLHETQTLLTQIRRNKNLYKKAHVFIAPPLPYFGALVGRINNFASLASQDITLVKGVSTGEVTPDILKSFGIKLSILGHSERRALGETSEIVSLKARTALRSGIIPLVCVGENERDADGEHFENLAKELKESLSGLSKREVPKIIIAYEPTWAIGKSARDAIDPDELSETIIFLKKILSDLFGRKISENIPILYGGSVEPTNARELMKISGVRGFLVGHASLKAKDFEQITKSIIER